VITVAAELQIHRFLAHEARLLDEEQWRPWLGLMTTDVTYRMPSLENRFRRDRAEPTGDDRMAFFDDNYDDLERRVTRFCSPAAWAEDPPTRHLHIVSNIEVDETDQRDEWLVRSIVTSIRNRGQYDQDTLSARREDVLRSVAPAAPDDHRHPLGELRIAQRTISIRQTVLLSKNINTFL
jgi:ethylbenzene dioxygenase beta subunit